MHGAVLSFDRFNRENSAYWFDGVNDYILLGSDLDYEERTISGWFCAGKIDNYNRIYSSDHPNLKYGLTKMLVHNAGTQNKLYMSQWVSENFMETDISSHHWYFAAVSITGNKAKYYVNGVLIDSIENEYIKSDVGLEYAVLGASRELRRFFRGKIDDVRIYNRTLVLDEIVDLYHRDAYVVTVCDTTEVTVYDTVKITVYDSVAVTDTLIIDVTISVNQEDVLLNRIKVYPNPAKDIIYIENSDFSNMSGYSIVITNSLGETVMFKDINDQIYQLDVDELGATGLYIIRIIDPDNKEVEHRKIILE